MINRLFKIVQLKIIMIALLNIKINMYNPILSRIIR